MPDAGITVVGLMRVCPDPSDGLVKAHECYRQLSDSTEYILLFDKFGAPVIAVNRSGARASWTFNPIKFLGTGFMVFTMITRGNNNPSFELDNINIPLRDESLDQIEIRLSGKPPRQYKEKFLQLTGIEKLPLRERTFLNKIQKMESRTLHGSESDILEAAADLRTLLINDGLIIELLRTYGVKLRFSVAISDKEETIYRNWANGFDNLLYIFPKHEELDRDKFQRKIVGSVKCTEVTVKDIIKLASNYLGSHHYGIDRNRPIELSTLLFEEYEALKVNGNPAVLKVMQAICFCYLDGVEPLVGEILRTN